MEILKGNFKLVRVFPKTYFEIKERRSTQVVFDHPIKLSPGQRVILVPFNTQHKKELPLPSLRMRVAEIVADEDTWRRKIWFLNLEEDQE